MADISTISRLYIRNLEETKTEGGRKATRKVTWKKGCIKRKQGKEGQGREGIERKETNKE